jgi:hypothetical protein
MNNNDFFSALSEHIGEMLRKGDYAGYAQAHKQMALVLHSEERYIDEIKSRILAFYFDTSGENARFFVDIYNTESIAYAAECAGIGRKELECIYFDTIRSNTFPGHPMTLKGSYRMMILCIEKKWPKVNKIVSNLRQHKC